MKIERASGLFSAIAVVACLGLVPACATSDSTSAPGGGLAETSGAAGGQEGDPVGENDTDAELDPEPVDETGETGDVAGETEDGGETGGDSTGGDSTGGEPPMADLDGDSEVNPAVRAQFRVTAAPPVSVDVPLFNDSAIDTRGLRYEGEVSNPGDQHDFVVFSIVPGQVDPSIGVFIGCGQPGLGSDSVRAHLFHEDGTLLETVVCGDDEQQILLEAASSDTEYLVRVEVLDGSEQLDTYSLELNGYCFQGCDFQPYGG